MNNLIKFFYLLTTLTSLQAATSSTTIFVPRQLSYNPILENSLTFNNLMTNSENYCLSFKPIYTQNTGHKLGQYFNIDQKETMSVQENGTGDIDSLWFQVISSNPTYYRSDLSFHARRRTYGGMLYFAAKLPHRLLLSINTALVTANNNIHTYETNIENLGVSNYLTITESLGSIDIQ